MNIIRRNFPNFLTCMNALAGCVAVVFAFSARDSFGPLAGWQCAAIALAVAVAADFFDGFSARLLKAWSEIGKELDSLSDLVSFGVAPAMLLLNLLAGVPGMPQWAPWCSLLIPVAGALRLARFNVDTRQTSSFIGLPIPANAIFWTGYAALAASGDTPAWITSPWLALPLIAAVSLLMLAPVRLFSLKFHSYGWKGNESRWILIAGSAALIISLGLRGLIPVILLYLLLSAFTRKSDE